ncbi:Gfo/Idh/MocA family oxidoreductase [Arthrobacter sp. H14]|uniref:Gfo/Idh/MocA family oxidoreductase n=1 Tax=Arthrobacter sp. H14 TaxID=1312959 RepID=UPI00047EA927|nr:Gfo/Idh/MocA family oxidoreductase [Arthrobacter sp. H14]
MNKPKKLIRTALVGFGLSGRAFHAPNIAADDRFSLDVIVTGNPERAAAAAQLYPQARIVPTRGEMFAMAADLDLMVVATPPYTHVGFATDGIAHGLHVAVDKPFVVNSAEGSQLIEQATAAGVLLTVFQSQRWDEDFLSLQQMISDGHFGEVHTFESRFERWSPQCRNHPEKQATVAGSEGLFFDLGTRVVEQAKELFGPVKKVSADDTRHSLAARWDNDDDTYVALEHASGVRSRLWMNRTGPRFRVLGSESTYTQWGLDGQQPALAAGVLPEGSEPGTDEDATWGRLGPFGDLQSAADTGGSTPDFYRMLADSLLDGGPVPVDPAGPLEVLRIMESIRASA